VRLLVDTHILLALLDPEHARLSSGLASMLRHEDNTLHVSAASLWEIAVKTRIGKLAPRVPLDALPEALGDLGLRIVAINERHALVSVEPEPPTRDPFDRMLLAQCKVEGMLLVTLDRALVDHPLAAGK
jgi:PIN domain nuclease of toxin-antitoxin system